MLFRHGIGLIRFIVGWGFSLHAVQPAPKAYSLKHPPLTLSLSSPAVTPAVSFSRVAFQNFSAFKFLCLNVTSAIVSIREAIDDGRE